jgi:hypothetical protein
MIGMLRTPDLARKAGLSLVEQKYRISKKLK